jgi:hypothetical protein
MDVSRDLFIRWIEIAADARSLTLTTGQGFRVLTAKCLTFPTFILSEA